MNSYWGCVCGYGVSRSWRKIFPTNQSIKIVFSGFNNSNSAGHPFQLEVSSLMGSVVFPEKFTYEGIYTQASRTREGFLSSEFSSGNNRVGEAGLNSPDSYE